MWLTRGGIAALALLVIIMMVHKPRGPKTLEYESDQSIINVMDGEQEQRELTKEETIRQNPDDYPESLVELLDRNPETVEFIYDYPQEHEKTHNIDLSKEAAEGDIPYFKQWDERWGYETYGSDMIAITGCGPTCLSMVLCGLLDSAEWSPLKVAEYADQNGYYVEGSGTAWRLMMEGASQLGLKAQTVNLSEKAIRQRLEMRIPMICSMKPGDFTDQGHYIVLVGLYSDNTVEIRDPNSPQRTNKHWKLKDLTKQMKTIWSYQV